MVLPDIRQTHLREASADLMRGGLDVFISPATQVLWTIYLRIPRKVENPLLLYRLGVWRTHSTKYGRTCMKA
jgi:hypothetical protein